MPRPRQPLIVRIKERCTVDEAGCWTWTGRVIDGQPEAEIDGSRRCVRPALYVAAFGRLADIPASPPRIIMAGGTRLCVNPHHMVTAGSSSGSLQPPSASMSATDKFSNDHRDQVSCLPPVATSTVLPERPLVARLQSRLIPVPPATLPEIETVVIRLVFMNPYTVFPVRPRAA